MFTRKLYLRLMISKNRIKFFNFKCVKLNKCIKNEFRGCEDNLLLIEETVD